MFLQKQQIFEFTFILIDIIVLFIKVFDTILFCCRKPEEHFYPCS